MKLSKLHEDFIEKARRPMSFGNLPINPIKNDVAILPVNRWTSTKSPSEMKKKFDFFSNKSRNEFISELLDYEVQSQHLAKMLIEDSSVTLMLSTKNIDQITEVDKEYAKFADELFKDIIYNPPDEK